MAVFFPPENMNKADHSGICYPSCLSLMETVASLTGISLAFFSNRKELISPNSCASQFCEGICKKMASEKITSHCREMIEALFKNASRTGKLAVGKCPLGLKSFVLPLKSEQGKVLFHVMGGHFLSNPHKAITRETIKEFSIPTRELNQCLRKVPVLDEEKFKTVIERLSTLSSLYTQEIKREGRELKFSRVVNFISEIARNFSEEVNLKELLMKIVEKVSAAFEVDKCAVALWDERKQFIEVFASNNHYADEIFGGKIEPGRGATGIVAFSGETFYSFDAQNDRRLYPIQIQNWEIKSLLSVPLKLGDRLIGCMHLVSQKERKMFLKNEVEFAEALGMEISLMVEIARLYSASEKRLLDMARSRDELKSYFTRLGTTLSTSLDLKQLLRIIVEISVHFTHSEAGSIYLIEEKKLSRYVAVAYGEGDDYAETGFDDFQRGTFDLDLTASTSKKYLEEKFKSGQINSYLGIPLVRKGEIKGLLNIMDRHRREFTPEEVQMLTVFADHAAMAIDNARLFQQEKNRAREATTLYEAARVIGESVELAEVLRQSTEQLTRVASVDRCIILLLDYKRLELYTAADKSLSDEHRDFFSYFRIPIDEIADDLWESLIQGKPVTLRNAPEELSSLKIFKVFPTSSCLLVPLLTKEQLSGLIFLDDSQLPHRFTESQIRLVMTLAIQIAAAIQRATLVEQLESNLNQLKALHQVSTAVTGTLSLPRVFDLVVDKASHLIDAPAASLLTLEDSTGEYVLRASQGLTGRMAEPEFQRSISSRTSKRRRYMTYYVSADIEGENPVIFNTLESSSMGGYVSIPLIARKKVVGILNCFCRENDKFDSQEIRLLRSFANQSAIAVENARLYLIIKNKVRELATVFEVGKSITSTLELDKVLDEVCKSVAGVMNADAVSIMNLDEEKQLLSIIKTKGLERFQIGESTKVGAGIAGIAAKIGRPMVLMDDDTQSSPYKFPPGIKQEGLKTILSVPLKVRGRVIGLINIYKKDLYYFTNNEINLFTSMANQAAVAIENARLYNEQFKIAQIMQRTLMPEKEMKFDNLEVGYVYIPSEKLSGDYFEIIPLSQGRYGMVISDVSGKGTGAAIYNARAKYIIRAYANANYPPSVLLTLLNHMMEEETAEDKFISLIYLDLDIKMGELIYSSAGHEPLLMWDDSEKEVLVIDEPNGVPIGIFSDTAYSENTYKVEKNDIILLYTDGITEARSREGEFFGVDSLIELFKANYHLDPQALANKIYTTVQKYTRRRITDDFSLLVVKI